MRFLGRSLMGLFLLAVTIGLLSYAGASLYSSIQARLSEEPMSRPARERVVAVNVVPYATGEAVPEFTTFGEVVSRRTLELRAPAAGAVTYLAPQVAEGASVTAGTLLAQIDPANAETALATAQADRTAADNELRDATRSVALAIDELAAAEEQVRLRDQALARSRDLAERGVGTAAQVETAELAAASARQSVLSRRQALAQAEARVDQATSTLARRDITLAEAQRRLEDTQIVAAFDGALSDVSLVSGGLVTANERLARLIDPTALEVAFRISTAQYARLLGAGGALNAAEVRVSLGIDGLEILAETSIGRESASVGEGQTGRQLFAPLPAGLGFRPGDFVSVTVVEAPLERVARLPAAAVDAVGNILLVGDENRLEVARVDVLRRQGDSVLVRARGLEGRQVVAERTPLLGAGIRVEPVAPGARDAAPQPPEMVALDTERRARLIAFVESNSRMPDEVRQRLLGQLNQPEVPAEMVARLESRMGS